MLTEFTCIMCPRGCAITGEIMEDGGTEIYGNACPKGETYVRQELCNPMRNISTSVKVINGEEELASVRLSQPIPKNKIFDVLSEIRRKNVEAPVAIGDVVISNVLNLGSDVIITKNIIAVD